MLLKLLKKRMASIRLLRGRIRSAKNIAQITKAMELVSASKMKKAQALAVAGKLYAQKIYDMVMELAAKADAKHHKLLTRPEKLTGKRLVIVISTNKGLCGGLNTNLFRFLLSAYPAVSQHDYMSIGKKGSDVLIRLGSTLIADFSNTSVWVNAVAPIIELAIDAYLKGSYDGVDLVYNEFQSALRQTPRKKTILPLTIEMTGESEQNRLIEFLIEPSVQEVFNSLLPHYIENQVRDAILQAQASEHSARMIAMRNASDNAMSFISDLTLMYNKVRQEKITYEISDMVTARLAVE